MPTVKQKYVVPIIAKYIKPAINNTLAGNSIRGTIQRAIKKGLITLHSDSPPSFDHDEFWSWAVRKWPQLAGKENIPVVTTINVSTGTAQIPSMQSTGLAYAVPSEDELLDAYDDSQAEIARLRTEVTELNHHKIRDTKLRKKLSDSGKKGGRGNKS